MNQNAIQYTIFLVIVIATISIADDNSNIHQNNGSDWIGVIIGVIIPALTLLAISVLIYAWLKRRRKNEETVEHKLKATSTARRYEQDLSIPDKELWEIDELEDSTLEEVSLNALEDATQLREANRIREYYAAISKIIRRYVETIFDIRTADCTTGEILENLPQNLTKSTVDRVGEILRICDIVEFAQYRPSNADLDHIYQLAVEFIENQIREFSDNDENSNQVDEEIFEQLIEL